MLRCRASNSIARSNWPAMSARRPAIALLFGLQTREITQHYSLFARALCACRANDGRLALQVSDGLGIERMEASSFTLRCLQTLTGMKIFATASKGTAGIEAFLRAVYIAYSDYVTKNPWYEPDMPIRIELFDSAVVAAAAAAERR